MIWNPYHPYNPPRRQHCLSIPGCCLAGSEPDRIPFHSIPNQSSHLIPLLVAHHEPIHSIQPTSVILWVPSNLIISSLQCVVQSSPIRMPWIGDRSRNAELNQSDIQRKCLSHGDIAGSTSNGLASMSTKSAACLEEPGAAFNEV